MASEAHIVLVDADAEAGVNVQARLAELEQRWSRFIATSDISRLNQTPAGQPVTVAADTCELLRCMQLAKAATEGRYDPTMVTQIIAAGYASSIDDRDVLAITVPLPNPNSDLSEVEVDPTTGVVTMPHGLGLDPGGIGKGLAAGIVVREQLAAGAAGALVSIGGDLVAEGRPPTSDGWVIAVEDPRSPQRDLTRFAVDGGGVATSSTLTRSWQGEGSRRNHHVLDPRTGHSSDTDLVAATVVAASGWQAEVHATAALLSGSEGVISYLERHGLSGIATTADGDDLATPDLRPIVEVTAR